MLRLKDSILNLVLMRMAHGYEEQICLYEKIYELALKQSECLSSEEVNTDKLLELINERQELIATLEEANNEMASLKDEVRETLKMGQFNLARIKAEVPGPGAESLEGAFFMLSRQLARIKELDSLNVKDLHQHIRGTSNQMARLQKTKRAHKLYQTPPQSAEGMLVDYSK